MGGKILKTINSEIFDQRTIDFGTVTTKAWKFTRCKNTTKNAQTRNKKMFMQLKLIKNVSFHDSCYQTILSPKQKKIMVFYYRE